ncbi:hypothetical protein EDB89DRAFT_1472225 [Lactarius sanguifluus]|nr:hypothetical protein EDB89DRAFT_1472225 [Lactarius sanguifluus]
MREDACYGSMYSSDQPRNEQTLERLTAYLFETPLVQATAAKKDAPGRRRPAHTRRFTSTLMQVATDHAFTGTYVQRFRTNDPPENISCPCGHPLRDSDHIIRHCPRFVQDRISTAIVSDVRSRQPLHPTSFLLVTGRNASNSSPDSALSKPESSLPVPPEPDWPSTLCL